MTNDFDHEYEYVWKELVGKVFDYLLLTRNKYIGWYSSLLWSMIKTKFWVGIWPKTSADTSINVGIYLNGTVDFWRKSKWKKNFLFFVQNLFPRIFDGVVNRCNEYLMMETFNYLFVIHIINIWRMSKEYMNNMNFHVHHPPLKVQRTIYVNGLPTTVRIFIQFTKVRTPEWDTIFMWILLPCKLSVKMRRVRTCSFTIFHSLRLHSNTTKIYYYDYCHGL